MCTQSGMKVRQTLKGQRRSKIILSSRPDSPSGTGPPHCWGFEITLRHTTIGRTSLDKWPPRCRDLCLTTHNTPNRQTTMSPAGFEPATPASKQPQTHALDRAATRIGTQNFTLCQFACFPIYCPLQFCFSFCCINFPNQHSLLSARKVSTRPPCSQWLNPLRK